MSAAAEDEATGQPAAGPPPRGSRLKRDVAVNVLGAVVRTAFLLWVVRLAAQVFSAPQLGLFLLARRLAGTAANLLQLGASQTLRRYLSIHADDPSARRDYVLVATWGWVAVSLAVLAAALAFRRPLGAWLFPGAEGATVLAVWTAGLALSVTLHFVIGSVVVAQRRIVLLNLLELTNGGGILAVVLLVWSGGATVAGLLQVQTIAATAISLIALAAIGDAIARAATRPPRLADAARTFRDYGLPRGPVTFLDGMVILLGPWLLRERIEESGFLILALSLLHVLLVAILPVSQIASVVTARLLGLGDEAAIRQGVRLLFGSALYLSALALALAAPWTDALLGFWLGRPELVAGVRPAVAAVLAGALPFLLFHALKAVIEMRWHAPYNLYALGAGLATQAGGYLALRGSLGPYRAASWSMLAMFWVLGALPVVWLRHDLRPLGYWGLGRLAVATTLAGTLSLAAVNVGGALSVPFLVLALAAAATPLLRPSAFLADLIAFLRPAPGR